MESTKFDLAKFLTPQKQRLELLQKKCGGKEAFASINERNDFLKRQIESQNLILQNDSSKVKI